MILTLLLRGRLKTDSDSDKIYKIYYKFVYNSWEFISKM